MEVAPKGVHVEHVNAYFVTTAMSKIRRYVLSFFIFRASWTTPTPKDFVRSVLQGVGRGGNVVPYFSHAIAGWVIGWVGEGFLIRQSRDMHISIRKRALKKQEREASKDK
jgi:17beta-estradiol 17-dehydrogenase / very-long-chain 3-oxoacyl-CoA reductase